MTRNENIWVPQKRMAELFGCSSDNFSLHLKNIYKEKELDESATTEDLSVVQFEVDRSVVPGIFRIYSLPTSYRKIQYVQFLHILPKITRIIRQSDIMHDGGKGWHIRSPNPK